MNKTVKRILIGTGIVIVLLALVMGGFMLKMKSEMKKMNVIETKEVVHNIYSIKDSFVNMFLVKDSDKYIAIDAGNDINVINNELQKLSIDPDKVMAIFLTHTDGDHVAAISLFKNAKLYLSHDEEQMINGKTARAMRLHNKISTKSYTLVDDQQILKIGNLSIKGILTPGHTPGSMSYLINDTYLFVGDAFGLKNGKVDKPNEFFTSDMKSAIQSFDKIRNLPHVVYLFTAHTGYSSDYKNAINTKLK
jgi:glyoxylase-like metal-dependent hydrolase (beta-lactamase superfamily II)